MSDDKMKDRLAVLQQLNNMATGIDDYSDPMANMDASDLLGFGGLPNISEEDLLREMNGGFGMDTMTDGVDTPNQMSDFDAALMEMAALSGGLGADFGGMSGISSPEMSGFGATGMPGLDSTGMPGMSGLGMPGMAGMPGFGGLGTGAKEVGTYDTVIVHGMRGNYVLTFEETEEGLEITVKR